jgi:hypothetical protein
MEKNDAIIKHRVIALVDRQELEFLDKLGKDSMFSTGHKLSYTEILKALLDSAMELGITGENIGSAEKLKEEIVHLVK